MGLQQQPLPLPFTERASLREEAKPTTDWQELIPTLNNIAKYIAHPSFYFSYFEV